MSEQEDFENDSTEGDYNVLQAKLEKLRKKIDEDLQQELEALDEQGLRDRIAQSECSIHESDRAKDADKELQTMLAQIKEMKAPYADVKKQQTAIIKYSTCLLEQMGKI